MRQQVLAVDTLLDVFGYVDRHTLDDANVVSAAYNTAAQHASPLRIVKDVEFYHNRRGKTFHVTVEWAYVGTKKGGMKSKVVILIVPSHTHTML